MKKSSAAIFLILALGLQMLPMMAIAQTTSTNQAGLIFSDVSASHVNADAIEYLKDQNIISGYPDKTYKPKSELNRAEFAKILIGSIVLNNQESVQNLINSKDPKYKNCFLDVKEDWYAPYVCYGKGTYFEGYSDGNFRPEEKIKFSEASKIIAKAFNIEMKGEAGQEWYKKPVTAMETENAIPLSVEFFDEYVTRDEMAEMVYRLKANISDKASRTYDEITGEELVLANGCKELEERYQFNTLYGHGRDVYPVDLESDVMQEEAAPPPKSPLPQMSTDSAVSNATAGGSNSYSQTNIQVAGVDEADIIKNDGKYIYIIKGNSIRIVEAYPAENLKELVSYSLGEENETFNPVEMYVDGNTLAVMGTLSKHYVNPVEKEMPDDNMSGVSSTSLVPPMYLEARTKIFVIDITDRSKPGVVRSVEFDGNYHTSRKIDDTVYMVMNRYPYYPYYFDAKTQSYTGDNSRFLPKMRDSKQTQDELISPCDQIRILPKTHNFNFLITAAVPLKDFAKEVSRSVVVGNTENVYASKQNLYVASTDWNDGFYRPYGSGSDKTALYKFALGNGTIEFKTQGKVPGKILNQFSMDENEGNFRIATTKNEFTMGSEIHNNLYILDSNLKLVGQLEKLAPGEKIYSVRFMGDRAYMVTFKRVDPLFVIDVGTPSAPKVLGELKIPGYSDYLHPYDENHIIGFGKDVDANALDENDEDFVYYDDVKGFKMAIFDVTDVKNPKEMFKEIIGDQGTMSDVLFNHKALLFDKEKGLMAFPINVFEKETADVCTDKTYSTCPSSCTKVCVPSSCTVQNGIKVCTTDCDGANSCVENTYTPTHMTFQGAYVYNVNLQDGFKLKGKITHLSEDEVEQMIENGYLANYEKVIQRILYIGENLYTVSLGAVKANILSDLQEKKMIELAGGSDGGIFYPMSMPVEE